MTSFTLNDLPTWIVLAAAVAIAWTLMRGKAGEAVSILQQANEVLAERVKTLERETKVQAATIAELQARTDFTVALQPVIESMQKHEENARVRGEKLLNVLDLLGERLGPEP